MQPACTQWLWGESWIWHEHESHFPQGVLAAVTLVGGGAGDGGARARAREWDGASPLLRASTTLRGAGARPQWLEQKPCRLVWAGGTPAKCAPSPLPALHRRPWGERCCAGGPAVEVRARGERVTAPVRIPGCSWPAAPIGTSGGRPSPIQAPLQVPATSTSHDRALRQPWQPSPSCGARGVERAPGPGWGSPQVPGRGPPRFQSASSAVCREQARVCARHQWSQGFLSPSCESTCLSNQLRELPSCCQTPGLTQHICGLNPSLPKEDLSSCNRPRLQCPFPGAQDPGWSLPFPSYLTPCGSCLQPWLYRSLPARLQFVLSETCPPSRCIFDVSVGGGELHVLPPLLPSWSQPHVVQP